MWASRVSFARLVRLGAGLLPAGGIATTGCTLRWAAGWPVADITELDPHTGADFEQALTALAGLAGWLCLGWFALIVMLELATRIPSAAGPSCARLAVHLSPRFMRTAARWLVAATVFAGPLVSGTAVAVGPRAGAGTPNLDRPAVVLRAPSPLAASGTDLSPDSTAEPPSYPTGAALDLDRPLAPFLPTAPAPLAVTVPAQGSHLLTGAPHRESEDDGYVVRRGDALWDVAARHLGPGATAVEIAREWPRWYAANRGVIGPDPSLIRPGQVLRAPTG